MRSVLFIYFHIKRKLENAPELRKFKYHGWMHTKNFYDAICYLAPLENINDTETRFLKIAALYHDTGYSIGNGDQHEYRSATVAREELTRFEFSESDINTICRLILSTRLGNKPKDILEKIMHDADFEVLGRDYFPYVSELLRAEMGTLPSIWRIEQIAFMKKHKYFTQSARKLFDKQKEINYRRLKGEQ